MSKGSTARPRSIGQYRVLQEIGRGHFGSTFAVERGGSRYALKWFSDAGDDARRGCENEADVLRVFDHPGIPRLYDEGTHQDRNYLVMTLFEGESLQRVLQRRLDEEGGVFGYRQVLTVLEHLFDAIAHVHGHGYTHRDIKDANIILRPGTHMIGLVDFGFCKPTGSKDAHTPDSFWGAGAARFSPVEKLEHPRHAQSRHDVFAVGVIGYLMLTGNFPWDVEDIEDQGAMREAMTARDPVALERINSLVPPAVGDAVRRLMTLEEALRPTAREASVLLSRTRTSLASESIRTLPVVRRLGSVFPEPFRDSLHGDIRLTEYEERIIDTPEFQRLRHVRQLGFSYLAFHGAEHSRFGHCVGVVAVTEKILRTIEDREGLPLDPEVRIGARLYSLLHDLGHIPFGHSLEDELGYFARHDDNPARINRLLRSRAGDNLRARLQENEYGRAALRLLLHQGDDDSLSSSDRIIRELVSGAWGADVLDYIDRDAFHCGLHHRVDTALFRQFRLDWRRTGDGRRLVTALYGGHGVRLDRVYAVESILRERFALYLKVYTHPKKVAATAMLDKALWECRQSKGGDKLGERELEWMGDESLLRRLADSDIEGVRAHGRALLARRLVRPVYRREILPTSRSDHEYESRLKDLESEGLFDPDGRRKWEAAVAARARVKPSDVLVYVARNAPGYQSIKHTMESRPGTPLEWGRSTETLRRMRELHLGLWQYHVFTTASGSGARRIEAEVAERWGANRLWADRKDATLLDADPEFD